MRSTVGTNRLYATLLVLLALAGGVRGVLTGLIVLVVLVLRELARRWLEHSMVAPEGEGSAAAVTPDPG